MPRGARSAADLKTLLLGLHVLRWFGLEVMRAITTRRRGHDAAARSRIHRRRGTQPTSDHLAHTS